MVLANLMLGALQQDTNVDVSGGACVTTISLTSGESGIDTAYAMSRVQAAEASTASMVGVANMATSAAQLGGETGTIRTLTAASKN